MTLPLTIDMLSHMYDFLAASEPFAKWNLPPSDDVKFKIVRTRHKQAWYQWDGKQHTITVSSGRVGHSLTLMVALAHEVVHLHLEESDMESKSHNCDTHNAAFRVLAEQVCKAHGFDTQAFY